MERQRIKNTLETTTNIAVLLVAVAALSGFAINFFRTPSPNLRAGLERGKFFGQIPQIDYGASRQTLLIALSTSCSYCRESVPFYRKLVDAKRQSNKDLRIIAFFPNKAEEVAKYVELNDLRMDTIADVQFAPLMISGNPSMILVNENGEVDDFWIGKLRDEEADQLIRSLASESLY